MVKPASNRSQTLSGRIEAPKVLKEGSSGADVLELKELLRNAGFDPGLPNVTKETFGGKTRTAVKAFQRSARLPITGIADAKTLESLKSVPRPRDFTTAPAVAPASPPPAKPAVSTPAMSPLDALRLVHSGEVKLTIPVKAGELIPRALTASRDTNVQLVLQVTNGVINVARSKMTFTPALSGPFGTAIGGIGLSKDADGTAQVDVKYLPNVALGQPGSLNLADFIERLATADSLPVKLLGFTIKTIDLDASPIDPQAIARHIDFANAKISVANVSFRNGKVPFGTLGTGTLGPDSKVTIEGTLADLRIRGHASLTDLNLDAGGTVLKGGNGSADLDVHLTLDSAQRGLVETNIFNLQLQADYAVSRRANGDYLELARGTLQKAHVLITQPVNDARPNTASLSIGQFEGTVNSGQITIPDGHDTARVTLGKTHVKGSLEVTDRRVWVSGSVDLQAQVDDYDSPGGTASIKMNNAKLQGKAQATFDSTGGVRVTGPVHLTSGIARGSVLGETVRGNVISGKIDASITSFDLSTTGDVDIRGSAKVDFGFEKLNLNSGTGFGLNGGSGRVTGTAEVGITDGSLSLKKAKLKISGAVNDGRLNLGSNLTFDIKAGSTIEGVMTRALFADEAQFDMTRLKVDATLDRGTMQLPDQHTLHFHDGAKVRFALDQLKITEHSNVPELGGSIELQASVGLNQIDAKALVNLPGITFKPLEGVEQYFKLKLGRFSMTRDGAFEVHDLSFGLEATVRHFGGRITPTE